MPEAREGLWFSPLTNSPLNVVSMVFLLRFALRPTYGCSVGLRLGGVRVGRLSQAGILAISHETG